MNTHDKNKHHVTVIEAVETLTTIADMEFGHEVTSAKPSDITQQNEIVTRKTIECLHDESIGEKDTIPVIKELFQVILKHIQNFYDSSPSNLTEQQVTEGIKNIMVIVGEAAKKLDRYTTIFQTTKEQSVVNLKEYRQLQEFYLRKVAKKVDDSMISKWVLALSLRLLTSKVKTSQEELGKVQAKHVFVDLDTVKKDDEYELFFIRKDDGSRFFSPRLLRNIKLVCDFGDQLGDFKDTDILKGVKLWYDYVIYSSANQILRYIIPLLPEFRHETQHIQKHELVADINKAIMALMLSSHEKQLLRNIPTKSCQEYFADFLHFLRQALQRGEYQKMLAYPPHESNKVAQAVLNMAHGLCSALFLHLKGLQEMIPNIKALIAEANASQSKEHAQVAEDSNLIWNRLANDYAAMNRLMKKRHPHGPLLKVLSILDEESYHSFDPLMQQNIPCHLYNLEVDDAKIANVRFASPIHQEYISSAKIIEEFKGMLRDRGKTRHLCINLQDKTSWREYCRCAVMEDLPHIPDLDKKIVVATLAKDTDFYHQNESYSQQNQVDVFIDQFKEHLESESSGFYFPDKLKTELVHSGFIDQSLEAIHKLFFSGKEELTREERLEFIEIFYLFLELKLIDLVQPTSFSLTCKDCVDRGEAASAAIFVVSKLLNSDGLNEKDWDYLNFILYGPSILIRERTIITDPFNRMLSAIKRIEATRAEIGKEDFVEQVHALFEPLYLTSILHANCSTPST